jgi:D-alanine-D-alanine ligase
MKVLLLAGGNSNEREVSLASGAAVYRSLVRLKHTVFAIDAATGKSLLTSDNKFIDIKTAAPGQLPVPASIDALSLAKTVGSPGFRDIDVVFIALHGGAGENGAIQCLLELGGKKFTGSGMTASAIAMDKAISKRLVEAEGIRTPAWSVYRLGAKQVDDNLAADIASHFKLPIIVKPNDGGSTIGLTKVTSDDQLVDALKEARHESGDILIEEFIAGREMTVALLDGKPLPVVEIKPLNDLYDYEAKYTSGKSVYEVPAKIDVAIAKDLQEAAVKAYNAIGAAGLARVDFILTDAGESYYLEVNTVPGMTDLSLAPMAAKEAGLEYDELISSVLESTKTR